MSCLPVDSPIGALRSAGITMIFVGIFSMSAGATDYCSAMAQFSGGSGILGHLNPPLVEPPQECVGECGSDVDLFFISITFDSVPSPVDQLTVCAVGDCPQTGNLIPVLGAAVVDDGGALPDAIALPYSEEYDAYMVGEFSFSGSPLVGGETAATLVVAFEAGQLNAIGYYGMFGWRFVGEAGTVFCAAGLDPCSAAYVPDLAVSSWGTIKGLFRP